MRKVFITIPLCLLVVACTQPSAKTQPFAAELEAVFDRAGVDLSAVHVETPAAAAFPLIEGHNHLNANIAAETLIDLMDRARVEAMLLMPRHYRARSEGGGASDEQALDYARRYPGRFIAFVGGQRDDLGPRSRVWRDKDRADVLLREFAEKLGTGSYRGIGEFILVHHAYDAGEGETGGEVRISVDNNVMRRIAALAAEHHVPVLFHAEAEERPAEEADALIGAFPGTLFIWAHNCGRASAEQTARRLRRFPNLMCDLGHMFNGPRTQAGYGKGWPRKTPWVHLVQDDAGRVLPEMKRLFETFPDRFMIGTDSAHTHVLKFYEYRIAIFRVTLAQLAPEAARKIAFENARRVFTKSGGRN